MAKTTCDTTLATQKLARVLYYLDNVRTAYMASTRRGNTTDDTWFSPELEYHTWLDFVETAYHNAARASIAKKMRVTFEYVMERQRPDILTFSRLTSQTPKWEPLLIITFS